MKARIASSAACAVLLGVLVAGPAAADIVTIEPDSYAPGTDLMGIAPGAFLFNYRRLPGAAGPSITPALATPWSWIASSPAPTGTQVFGHVLAPSDHWAGIQSAKDCVRGVACGPRFYVFTALFETRTSYVEVRTTMAPWAIDGAELWAFDSSARPIAACTVSPVGALVRRTGIMPNPTLGSIGLPAPVPGIECGKVLAKLQCKLGGEPGECSYIVSAHLKRPNRDIAFVMWGAYHVDDSTAPVDRLRYEY
jgi:hypothetical protein